LEGLLTARDIHVMAPNDIVKNFMTKREKLIVFSMENMEDLPDITKCEKLMLQNRIEKLPVVNNKNLILGLVTLSDIKKLKSNKMANLDDSGSLFVAAAVGCRDDFIERAQLLISKGVDAIVVDVANGHN